MDAVFVARHAFAGSNRDGTAESTVPGRSLTPEGEDQAKALAVSLASEDIELGVSSELARARETLALALGGRDVPRIELRELNEVDFGSYDGGLLVEYRAWAAESPPELQAPGNGESRAAIAARVARGLRVILARSERSALVVAHALVVRYVLDAADGLVPAPLITPVPHAVAQRVRGEDLAVAATLLEEWSRTPRFRDPSVDVSPAPPSGR